MPENNGRGGNPDRRRQRNNRRRRFHDRHWNDRNRKKREENRPALLCALCEKEIKDTASAIGIPENGNPAHFDCIIKKISETEPIAQHEKICYLGKGSFGIVRFQRPGGSVPFVIRKRIQFEVFEETPQWRKELTQYRSANPFAERNKKEDTPAGDERAGAAPAGESPQAQPPPAP